MILDAFCGAGGNAIQFAVRSMHVLAFDNRIDTVTLVSIVLSVIRKLHLFADN